MTSRNPGPTNESGELSDEQRAAIFSAANAPKDRGAAFRAGRLPVSSKFVMWAVAAILFLGLGGEVAQHFFGTYGKAPRVTTPTSPVLNLTTTTNPSTPTLISLESYIGLKFIGTAQAPGFTLKTQSNKKWSLASQKGKVVVLAFYNSICNDICPVLGSEIREARHELGPASSKIVFVIVNTDPNKTSVSGESRALLVPGLSKIPSVKFLTGSVAKLDAVWSAYGIRVYVGAKANEVSHNNALYFIGPNGNLEAYAKPFAAESKSGTFSLDASSIHLYAQGIAETADSLVK